MNFYKHHLGDYEAATAHLTWLQDCAYMRLMRLYYRTEKPIPEDINSAFRLLRAASKAERDAVCVVLAEFFTLEPDGWRSKRCDQEIAAAAKKAEANRTNGKQSSGRPQKKPNATPSDNPVGYDAETQWDATGFRHARGTNSQTPEARLQDKSAPAASPPPVRAHEDDPPEVNGQPATAAGSACIAIRQAGIGAVNPGHPDLLRLLAAGVTPQDFADTAAELVGKGKGKFPLLLATVEGRLRDAADAGAVPMAPPDPMAWRKTADGVFAMAERLGVKPAPDDFFHVFERRVLTAFQRAGQAQETAA